MRFRDVILTVVGQAERPPAGTSDVIRALEKAGFKDESVSKLPLKTRVSAELSKLKAAKKLHQTGQGLVVQ